MKDAKMHPKGVSTGPAQPSGVKMPEKLGPASSQSPPAIVVGPQWEKTFRTQK